MKNIIQNAVELAYKYHSPNKRKVSGDPEFIHPVMVATILAKNGFSDETIAAGFCHDLLEDTRCSEQEINEACGENVLEIVKAVTNEDIDDWKEKKRRYIKSVKEGPVEAKAVCCADKIHNLQSTLAAYPNFTPEEFWGKFNATREDKHWFEEDVLRMLKSNWNHPLIKEFETLLEESVKLK